MGESANVSEFTQRVTYAVLQCVAYSLLVVATTLSAQVPYAALLSDQQDKFKTSCPSLHCDAPALWKSHIDSEQLEFAGGTQAMRTVALEPQVTGLQQLQKIDAIVGSVQGAPSQDQFHITVRWIPNAANLFSAADGWSEHPTWFHRGQFGYQPVSYTHLTLPTILRV